MRVAHAMLEMLRDEGVDRIFGNPGTTELPLIARPASPATVEEAVREALDASGPRLVDVAIEGLAGRPHSAATATPTAHVRARPW